LTALGLGLKQCDLVTPPFTGASRFFIELGRFLQIFVGFRCLAEFAFGLSQVMQRGGFAGQIVQEREPVGRELPGTGGGGPILLLRKLGRLFLGAFRHADGGGNRRRRRSGAAAEEGEKD